METDIDQPGFAAPVAGAQLSFRALLFDLRCLEDEAGFISQLDHLVLG